MTLARPQPYKGSAGRSQTRVTEETPGARKKQIPDVAGGRELTPIHPRVEWTGPIHAAPGGKAAVPPVR